MEKFEDLYDELLEREIKMEMETTSIIHEPMNDSTVLHQSCNMMEP